MLQNAAVKPCVCTYYCLLRFINKAACRNSYATVQFVAAMIQLMKTVIWSLNVSFIYIKRLATNNFYL